MKISNNVKQAIIEGKEFLQNDDLDGFFTNAEKTLKYNEICELVNVLKDAEVYNKNDLTFLDITHNNLNIYNISCDKLGIAFLPIAVQISDLDKFINAFNGKIITKNKPWVLVDDFIDEFKYSLGEYIKYILSRGVDDYKPAIDMYVDGLNKYGDKTINKFMLMNIKKQIADNTIGHEEEIDYCDQKQKDLQ